MFKSAFILIAALLVFRSTEAKTIKMPVDTLLYYLNNAGNVVSRDSADYTMFIMPRDPADKNSLFPVVQFYPDGKRKMVAASHIQSLNLVLEGPCINYFPSGRRKEILNYKNGAIIGDVTAYYPNGKLYAVKRKVIGRFTNTFLYIEFRDSTGTVLAENGNGKWLKFDSDFKHIIEAGEIKNGLETGKWVGASYNKIDSAYTGPVFTTADVDPSYKGGLENFNRFLSKTIRYPAEDREHNKTGRVFITMIVEKDGTLTHLEAHGPSSTLNEEGMRVARLSPPWTPALIGGEPVRVLYTFPLNFTLAN